MPWRQTSPLLRTYASSTDPSNPEGLQPKPQTDPAGIDQATSKTGAGPNTQQAPHVSEEAAAMSKMMGNENSGPDMDQGTTVGDAIKHDEKELKDSLPKVMKDAMKKSEDGPKGSRSFSTFRRSFSTSARRSLAQEQVPSSQGLDQALVSTSSGLRTAPATRAEQDYPGQFFEIDEHEARLIATGQAPDPLQMQQQIQKETQDSIGLKFPPPSEGAIVHSGFGRRRHRVGTRRGHQRYDSVVDQVIGLIMQHGKKAKAQRAFVQDAADILAYLRTAPAPTGPPQGSGRNLVLASSSAPTASALPLDPIAYLTSAIDSAAPILKLQSRKGYLGGGATAQVPMALSVRQRRRLAICWLRDAAQKKAGAPSPFPKRFAEEVVAVVDGKSSAWERRLALHRAGVAGRSYLSLKPRSKQRK
ncbi:MAG: hypothetical protein M1828_001161 [Chrysothrix sp. TS-e1954]|nr:MAG: hypothetical protein M1828_001161 [Chrysothrix sp. TS-e1954]